MVQGYHGTDRIAAEKVLREGFQFSRNDYDWLGDGIYFFQDAPRRALEWAQERRSALPCVIGAEISLENCIDLLDSVWSRFLTEAYDGFLKARAMANQPLPVQRGGAHRLDRYVLNYACDVLEEAGYHVCSVRSPFIEGTPLFPNSALLDKSHIQIVIRDPSVIGSIWLEESISEVSYV